MSTSIRILPILLVLHVFSMPCLLSANSDTTRIDSIRYGSVLIIPFDGGMYFSDADQQLARHNRCTPEQVMQIFRYGLSGAMNAAIINTYSVRQILTDTIKGASDDLQNIYRSIGYKMEKPMGVALQNTPTANAQIPEAMETKKTVFNGKLFNKDHNGESTGQRSNTYNTDSHERRYMNVVIHNPAMLKYLKEKYGTDLFLFFNQFEIKTNYENCLDRATQTFERTIKVHYSLFDENGKQLAGDVATVHFGSNTNDIHEIITKNFPFITSYIKETMPRPKKVKTKDTSQPGIMDSTGQSSGKSY